MDFRYYSDADQRLGLAPNEGDVCALSLAGEAVTVDTTLHWLLRLWSVYPVSTVVWDTVDGCAPQPDEPARATVLVKMRDLAPKGDDHSLDPRSGPAAGAAAGQDRALPVS